VKAKAKASCSVHTNSRTGVANYQLSGQHIHGKTGFLLLLADYGAQLMMRNAGMVGLFPPPKPK
jgi:hypothetical protein